MKLFEYPFQNFKALKIYKFDFQSFAIKAKNKRLERKQNGSLSKNNFDDKRKEKSKSSISNNQ
jgi:hypothetical protein